MGRWNMWWREQFLFDYTTPHQSELSLKTLQTISANTYRWQNSEHWDREAQSGSSANVITSLASADAPPIPLKISAHELTGRKPLVHSDQADSFKAHPLQPNASELHTFTYIPLGNKEPLSYMSDPCSQVALDSQVIHEVAALPKATRRARSLSKPDSDTNDVLPATTTKSTLHSHHSQNRSAHLYRELTWTDQIQIQMLKDSHNANPLGARGPQNKESTPYNDVRIATPNHFNAVLQRTLELKHLQIKEASLWRLQNSPHTGTTSFMLQDHTSSPIHSTDTQKTLHPHPTSHSQDLRTLWSAKKPSESWVDKFMMPMDQQLAARIPLRIILILKLPCSLLYILNSDCCK